MNANARLRLFSGFSLCLCAAMLALNSCTEEDHKQELPNVVQQELDQVRQSVIPYRDLKKAIAAGYDHEVTGYRAQMGYHYLNAALLDDKFELQKPEILLYAPYGKDSMKLVAVEYATPIADIRNPPAVPEGFTGKDDEWEINTEFNLWTLHAWVELENTHGIFAPHNTKLP